jgi:hypothetical protein
MEKDKNNLYAYRGHLSKTMSFKEEYILFLNEYGIEYNEDYL